MNFLRKNLTNILFVLFALFLFTPYGLPVRALLIKGVSVLSTAAFGIEVDAAKQEKLNDFNWQLQDRSGTILDFETLKGKVVLVNYWATWCPPCVAEMPGMEKLYMDYEAEVEFLFIARDEPMKVDQFLKKRGLDIPVYYENSAPPALLSSSSLPTTFVIDSGGMIRVDKVGAADWNSSKVRRLLDELIQ